MQKQYHKSQNKNKIMKRKILSIDEFIAEEKMYESLIFEYDVINEAENLREEYQKYFKETLESFGVSSMGELPKEKRSEFFNKIKEGWEKGKGRKGKVNEAKVSDEDYKKAVELKNECEKKKKKLKEELEESNSETTEAEKTEKQIEIEGLDKQINDCDFQITGYDGPLKESEILDEAKIESDDDFKEYAENKLKKAFGDKYDAAKAKEVIDGLLKKKSDDNLDYGAIIGMLNK